MAKSEKCITSETEKLKEKLRKLKKIASKKAKATSGETGVLAEVPAAVEDVSAVQEAKEVVEEVEAVAEEAKTTVEETPVVAEKVKGVKKIKNAKKLAKIAARLERLQEIDVDASGVDEAKKATKKRQRETEGEPSSKRAATEEPSEEDQAKNQCSVFVRGLDKEMSHEEVAKIFADCGPCVASMFKDLEAGAQQHKGMGVVHFETAEAATKALTYDGTEVGSHWIQVKPNTQKNPRKPKEKSEGKKNDPGEKPDGCETVIISNLSYETTEATIQAHFEDCGPIRSVCLVKNRETGESRGVAFVNFEASDATDKAVLKAGSEIDGRSIFVRFKEVIEGKSKVKGENSPGEKPVGCDTVIVSNLSYETTEDTIEEHFKDCGAMKSVLTVKDRETGESRGMAFIIFEDEESIDKAILKAGSEIDGRSIFVRYKADKAEKGKGKGKGDKGKGKGKGGDSGKGFGKGKGKGKGGDFGKGKGKGKGKGGKGKGKGKGKGGKGAY